jgi:hypothetical protein
MKADADKNLGRARALGATEVDIKKARDRMISNFNGMVILVGPVQACNALINNLAWAGSTPAVSDPKQPAKAK